MQDLIDKAKKFGVSLDAEIAGMLMRRAIVACGVSGGKDSFALTIRTLRFLRSINYSGEIICVHSDLGMIEHAASKENCVKLAEHAGVELAVIKPPRPMLEVWEYRWQGILDRFNNLKRVKLITPFSSAIWRFCTKATKTAPITQFLKNRFPGREIINAVGIRREESENRRKKPVSEECKELNSVTLQTTGRTWNAIIDLPVETVWLTHAEENFPRHEVYEKLDMSRVSCCFCVLANLRDLTLSLNDPRNHPSFHRIVELELVSGFSFQSANWLADIGFEYLSDNQKKRLEIAKDTAGKRLMIERDMPQSLILIQNFPPYQPNMIESEQMADCRRRLCELMNITTGKYLTARTVYDRFAEMLAEKEVKEKKKAAAAARKAAKTGVQVIDTKIDSGKSKYKELPLFA